MIHIGLFEGIGGFSIAARTAGWKTLVTCEIEPFCQRVLKYHFPNAYHHGDIKTLTYETINAELSNRYGSGWRNEPIVLTGGFPCQPYSTAGKRKGKEDDRHLWPQMLRTIREISPEWVVGENVSGLISWSGGLVFEEVQTDLEAEGYEVWPVVLPAAGVGAPHRRDRVWFIARTSSDRRQRYRQGPASENREQESREPRVLEGGFEGLCLHGFATYATSQQGERVQLEQREFSNEEQGEFRRSNSSNDHATDSDSIQRSERGMHEKGSQEAKRHLGTLDSWDRGRTWENFPTQSPICGRNDGFPGELDGITLPSWRNNTIKAFGNAIVPQVAFQIFKVINLIENKQ